MSSPEFVSRLIYIELCVLNTGLYTVFANSPCNSIRILDRIPKGIYLFPVSERALYGRIYCVDVNSIFSGKKYDFIVEFRHENDAVYPIVKFVDRLIPHSFKIVKALLVLQYDSTLSEALEEMYSIVNDARPMDAGITLEHGSSNVGTIMDIETLNKDEYNLDVISPFHSTENVSEITTREFVQDFVNSWKTTYFGSGVEESLNKLL